MAVNVGPAYYDEATGQLIPTGAVMPSESYGLYNYGQVASAPVQGQAGGSPGGGELLVDVDKLPEPLRTGAISFMGPLNAVRMAWESLPDWLRNGLIVLGIIAAVVVLVRSGVAGAALGIAGRAVGGLAGGAVGLGLHGQAVKTWLNGTMAKFADGYLGARRKDGSWTYWKPKKPIVLMPGKRMALGQLLKADLYLDRETKRLAKMLRRRLGTAGRGHGRRASTMVIESGPGSVRMLPQGN